MTNEIRLRHNELPERRIYVIEEDVGDETIDAGVDTASLCAEYEFLVAEQMCDHLQIRDTPRVGIHGLEATDPLVVISLEVVLLRASRSSAERSECVFRSCSLRSARNADRASANTT